MQRWLEELQAVEFLPMRENVRLAIKSSPFSNTRPMLKAAQSLEMSVDDLFEVLSGSLVHRQYFNHRR